MKKLIEALQIFSKYTDEEYPTSCEHDVLYVSVVSPNDVSKEDIKKLKKLGFEPDYGLDVFYSFKYGSC